MTDYSGVASFFVGTAINLMIFSTPIAVTAAVVLRFTSGAPARLRYMFTVTAFVAAAALPFALALTQTDQTELQTPAYVNARVENPIQNRTADALSSNAPPLETEPTSTRAESGLISAWRSLSGVLNKPSISIGIMSVWILGSCLLFIREAVAHFSVAHARRNFIKAEPKLLRRLVWPQNVSLYLDDYCGPYTLGVTHPIVVMPARLLVELPEEALNQIARHELDHLKWHDPFANAAMRLVLALLWPSAPLWYLNRMARLEREAAADQAAIKAEGSELRRDTAAADYASALVAIGRKYASKEISRPYALAATEIGEKRGLDERVRRLLTISSPPDAIRIFVATATLLAGISFVTLLPVVSVRSKAKQLDPAVAHVQPEPLRVETPIGMSNDGPKEVSAPAIHSPARRRLTYPTSETLMASMESTAVEIKSSNNPIAVNKTVDAQSSSNTAYIRYGFEEQMAALGYTNLSADQIMRMRQYAVGPAYVREMAELGYRGLDAEMLITFKWLAVSRSYIEEMKSLGYERLPPRLLVNFRQHGVSPEYIKAIRSRLTGHITAEQLASLRLYGVSMEFLDRLKALGYDKLNADQIISMRLQGVTITYIEQMQARLSTRVSADELISMRMRNIY